MTREQFLQESLLSPRNVAIPSYLVHVYGLSNFSCMLQIYMLNELSVGLFASIPTWSNKPNVILSLRTVQLGYLSHYLHYVNEH